MPAASLNSLPSLRKLSIQRMDGHIRPLSIEDLTTVLSAIPRIEDLHIGHIRCSDSRYPEPPNSIMLPDLLRLRLSFGIPDSIHLLVPLIAAPRLRRLSLRITNSGHVIAAARCADKFSSVRRVVICGRVDAGVRLLPLLSVFHNLQDLDLRGSRSGALAELVAESKRLAVNGRTTFAPNLRRLALGPSPMSLVKDLVILHSFLTDTGLPVFGLNNVHVRYSESESLSTLDGLDLGASRWLSANLPGFCPYTSRGPIYSFHTL
jgi:hypothetical protein